MNDSISFCGYLQATWIVLFMISHPLRSTNSSIREQISCTFGSTHSRLIIRSFFLLDGFTSLIVAVLMSIAAVASYFAVVLGVPTLLSSMCLHPTTYLS